MIELRRFPDGFVYAGDSQGGLAYLEQIVGRDRRWRRFLPSSRKVGIPYWRRFLALSRALLRSVEVYPSSMGEERACLHATGPWRQGLRLDRLVAHCDRVCRDRSIGVGDLCPERPLGLVLRKHDANLMGSVGCEQRSIKIEDQRDSRDRGEGSDESGVVSSATFSVQSWICVNFEGKQNA